MPAYRFYLDQELTKNTQLTVEGAEVRHITQVMRLQKDDSLEIINGNGSLATAKISTVEKRSIRLEVIDLKNFELKHSLNLYQAILKPSSLEWLIEKATELGATNIYLFHAEKSSSHLSENKLDRLKQKAVASLKQSGRLFMPTIELINPIDTWDQAFENAYYGALHTQSPPLKFDKTQALSWSFCSGPEAGFSTQEEKQLEKLKFKNICINANILRAESAPLCFLSIVGNQLLNNREIITF